MNQATTAIASRHYAEQAAGGDQEAIEQVYFHLVRGEQPPPLGEAEAPPASARVWKGEDWLDTAPDGLFTSYCGDCQPRAADGEVLQTAERLAIAAARARDGMHGPEAWANVDATAGADAIWIAATGERGAIRVAQVAETDQHSAMRDLSGKNGYGRARGTENIDRPDQKARTAALALHVDEIARGSGIELARDDRSEAIDGQLARLEVHADGGTRATLGRGWAPTPSIPDLVDEATAVAVAPRLPPRRAGSRAPAPRRRRRHRRRTPPRAERGDTHARNDARGEDRGLARRPARDRPRRGAQRGARRRGTDPQDRG